jgi:streptogramin lyase
MTLSRTATVAIVVVLFVVASATAYLVSGGMKVALTTSSPTQPTVCLPLGGTKVVKNLVQNVTFGAVTEFALPTPSRWPNALTVAPDGSVWFGEQSVPGVGHLYKNGTLVEYPWPTAGWSTSASCGYRTGIWGITLWDGMVWASDGDENALVGINPQYGVSTIVNLTGVAPLPYTLAVSPEGDLWFTTESSTPKLGRLTPDMSLTVYSVDSLDGDIPLQVDFVNASYAYFVGLNPYNPPYGHLYSFDPETTGATIDPAQVGGAMKVIEPTSVSASGVMVWVAQHGTSSIIGYDTLSGQWTIYPTSVVNYTQTTLPYFVAASDSTVWFNEHYANRIALLNSSAGTLTEYSESDPPASNSLGIQNDVTIYSGNGTLWFASISGNYIGFVNEEYKPPFSISSLESSTLNVTEGTNSISTMRVTGSWGTELAVEVADSENLNSSTSQMRVVPSVGTIPAGEGPVTFSVSLTATPDLAPGRYTVAVSVSDGLLVQTAYLFLTVQQ